MPWNTIKLEDHAGEAFELIDWLRTLPRETGTHEAVAFARSDKRRTPMRIRLIARRKSPEAIAATIKLRHRRAGRKAASGRFAQPERGGIRHPGRIAGGGGAPAEEVLAIHRLRWRIEMAFKRLKSLLRIDKLRTRTDAGTRCWFYAHLSVALLGDDLCRDFLESFPPGAC